MIPRKPEEWRGRCPHCATVVKFEAGRIASFDSRAEEGIDISGYACPNCEHIVLKLAIGKREEAQPAHWSTIPKFHVENEVIIWPQYAARPVPPEVPAFIAGDYREATMVLSMSSKASAALSRRCLQSILRDRGFNQKDLWQQIAVARPGLPDYIQENIDAIRHIGNLAAHPGKEKVTGEIIEVEPGEAEWNLELLDQLFEFYYVQPAKAQANRHAINAKLKTAGKQPMK